IVRIYSEFNDCCLAVFVRAVVSLQRRTSTTHHNQSLGSCTTDVATNHILRVILFVIANSFIFASSFINMVICVPEDSDFRVTLNDTLNLFSRQEHDPPPHCQYGQTILEYKMGLTWTSFTLTLLPLYDARMYSLRAFHYGKFLLMLLPIPYRTKLQWKAYP
ncbi:hypothetical protein AVEN_119666-1, partial [Araneus ventricosus]